MFNVFKRWKFALANSFRKEFFSAEKNIVVILFHTKASLIVSCLKFRFKLLYLFWKKNRSSFKGPFIYADTYPFLLKYIMYSCRNLYISKRNNYPIKYVIAKDTDFLNNFINLNGGSLITSRTAILDQMGKPRVILI